MPNESLKKQLQKNTSKFLNELAIFVKKVSSFEDWQSTMDSTGPKSSLRFFFFLTQYNCNEMGIYLWKMMHDTIDNKNPLLTGGEGYLDGKTALYIGLIKVNQDMAFSRF